MNTNSLKHNSKFVKFLILSVGVIGIVIGVYRLILLMIYDVDNYIVESLMWGCLGTFFILKGIFMDKNNKFLRLANIGVAILAYWVILKKFLME